MYEMLTGKVPFDRPNSMNILMAHIQEQVPAMSAFNPSVRVPAPLEAVVRKSMAKNRDDRYLSMNEVLLALKHCIGASLTTSAEFSIPESVEHTLGGDNGSPSVHVSDEYLSGHTHVTGVTPALVPFAQASKPKSSGAPLFMAAIFAFTGIGGFLALNHPLDANPPPKAQAVAGPTPQAPVPATPVEPQVAPVPSGRTVVVWLRSTPPGAIVVVDGQEYGPTPTHLVWTGVDAAYGREVTFRFQRPGYRDITVTREVRGTRLDVEPRMDPLPARKPPVRLPTAAGTPDEPAAP
jgi:hypothetical protein